MNRRLRDKMEGQRYESPFEGNSGGRRHQQISIRAGFPQISPQRRDLDDTLDCALFTGEVKGGKPIGATRAIAGAIL
jgi:hypothetical protein